MTSEATNRCGFVALIGRPNVGKSTLLNRLLRVKLAITSNKAQTTRHRIHGILNAPDYQVIFSDTPGILDPSYKLQETMLKAARSALVDADVLIYLTEMGESPDPGVLRRASERGCVRSGRARARIARSRNGC